MFELPAPKRTYKKWQPKKITVKKVEFKKIPDYIERSKPSSKFIPESLDDFQDGGAFPELSIAQYPNNMGKITSKSSKSLTIKSCTNNN
eukprot:snap_masked-scaffold_57-processed-gene-1.53-mRNA-1 protein AED:0.00 eAED:0.00 QI:45/0.5/0.66/1/1/1/3/1812/88